MEDEKNRVKTWLSPKGRKITLAILTDAPSLSLMMQKEAALQKPEGTAFLVDYRNPSLCRDSAFIEKRAGSRALRLSLLLRPAFHAKHAVLLSSLSALALSRALETVAGLRPRIRWVDDIFCEKEKIAVTESSCELRPNGYLSYWILNISLLLPRHLFPETLSDIAKEVFEGKEHAIAGRIATAFLTEFFTLYESLAYDRSFIEDYKKRCHLEKRKIFLLRDGKHLRATVLGIDDDAHLLVETKKHGILSIASRSEVAFY